MSHINKNMSPSLGQTKRENLAMLAEMEKKLKETKVALGLIDRELEEGNAAMQVGSVCKKTDMVCFSAGCTGWFYGTIFIFDVWLKTLYHFDLLY